MSESRAKSGEASLKGASAAPSGTAQAPAAECCFCTGKESWLCEQSGDATVFVCQAHYDVLNLWNKLRVAVTHKGAKFGHHIVTPSPGAPASPARIDFGVHKGMPWSDPTVPDHYLEWVVKKSNHQKIVKYRAVQELLRRGVPAELLENVHAAAAIGNASTPDHDVCEMSDGPKTTASTTPENLHYSHPKEAQGVRKLLTPDDLAVLLKLHKETILEWRRQGKLPRAIVGLGWRFVRWPSDEIEAWIAAGMPSGAAWESSRASKLA